MTRLPPRQLECRADAGVDAAQVTRLPGREQQGSDPGPGAVTGGHVGPDPGAVAGGQETAGGQKNHGGGNEDEGVDL